jgi:hypothetical protein
MSTINKLILLFFIVFVFIPKGYSQNADPGIGILMLPSSVSIGSTGILKATVGNYGNNTIDSNSLRVTISVGASAEILGIASGSDIRWSQLTLTTGSANTITLTNTGFGSFDVGDILLTIRGNIVSTPDIILGNIVYIDAINPLLCIVPDCASPPLNTSQGNASISNNNSETSLTVTCATPSTPTVGTITQPTCAVATGSVILSGLPATGSWTVTGSPSGTATGTGTSTTISGLAAGTFTFTVTNADGCTSIASESVIVNTQPGTTSIPTVGAITQPTCAVATGSVVLNGLPSKGTWTVTGSPSGTATGTGTSTTISGLAAGTYIFTVTNAEGCISEVSANVVINTQPATPDAVTLGTVTQPTRTTATGSFSITNYNAAYTYVVSPSTGVSVSGSTVTAPAGTYTVTATSGVCTSIASETVTVQVFINLSDFTLTIDIDAIVFLSTAPTKDFVVNISEIGAAPSAGQVVVKIPKQSAFTITYGGETSTSNVFGGVSVNNINWIITENASFITMTLKTGVIIGANTISAIGFTIISNSNAPSQTIQPITATIVNGSGSDSVDNNNTFNIVVKAQ